MPTKKTAPEITGPSSEPKEPMVTLGKIAAPVARTTGQGITAEFIIQGFEVFNIWNPNEAQHAWLVVAGTALMSWITNYLEGRAGQRLIGTPT